MTRTLYDKLVDSHKVYDLPDSNMPIYVDFHIKTLVAFKILSKPVVSTINRFSLDISQWKRAYSPGCSIEFVIPSITAARRRYFFICSGRVPKVPTPETIYDFPLSLRY